MQNDQTVSENYQRLVAQTLAGVYEPSNNTKTVEQLRGELIGKIKYLLVEDIRRPQFKLDWRSAFKR